MEPLHQTLNTLNASLQALAAARNAPLGGTREDAVPTDAEIEEELQSGKTTKLKAMLNARDRQMTNQIESLRRQGLESISALTTTATLKDRPYYAKYQKEIDAQIAALPLEARANPQASDGVYKFVIGQHMEDIVKDEREKAVRNSRDKSAGSDPTGTRGTAVKTTDAAPTVADVFGAEADAALKSVGRDGDSFAKRLGYTDFQDYMTKTKEYMGNA